MQHDVIARPRTRREDATARRLSPGATIAGVGVML